MLVFSNFWSLGFIGERALVVVGFSQKSHEKAFALHTTRDKPQAAVGSVNAVVDPTSARDIDFDAFKAEFTAEKSHVFFVFLAVESAGGIDEVSRCVEAHEATSPRLHCSRAVASLRIIPSPEQGASISTMSKKLRRGDRRPVSPEVTIVDGEPHLTMFSRRTDARRGSYSFAMTMLPSGSDEMASVVLPPGAAHASSSRTGCRSEVICLTTRPMIIDDAS